MKRDRLALIMAGGQGTRFWPWSTEEHPKQFLSVIGEEPLLTQTYNRLAAFISGKNIFIVADPKYFKVIRECLGKFPTSNFIAEPSPRNTAPCLILANIHLAKKNPEANLLVVPADHCIKNEKVFAFQLSAALDHADNRCVITAGIKPTSPHTGYGYIQFDSRNRIRAPGLSFYPVFTFKEKPDLKKARLYLSRGNYYWNSGMFIYKLRHFKEFLKLHADYYFQKYCELEKIFNNRQKLVAVFNTIRPDSIDYVLMENLKEARMFEARFVWNDVGSWSSVYDMNDKDDRKNVKRGDPILINTRDSLVFSTEKRPLALIGMQDVAVISTPDGILISKRGDLQRVREVIAALKKRRKTQKSH